MTITDRLSLLTLIVSTLTLIVLIVGVIVARSQLKKAADSSRLSALAEVSAAQRAISEIMLRDNDLLATVYQEVERGEARKLIFFTLLINNASLAYEQIELGMVSPKLSKAFKKHLKEEFSNFPELRQRLEDTKHGYREDFVKVMLEP